MHANNHCVAQYSELRAQQLQILKNISKTLDPKENRSAEMENFSDGSTLATLGTGGHLREMASYLVRQPHDSLTTEAATARMNQRPHITVVRREWEEKFMHEPMGGETVCQLVH